VLQCALSTSGDIQEDSVRWNAWRLIINEKYLLQSNYTRNGGRTTEWKLAGAGGIAGSMGRAGKASVIENANLVTSTAEF
jgi:hypothetical protein